MARLGLVIARVFEPAERCKLSILRHCRDVKLSTGRETILLEQISSDQFGCDFGYIHSPAATSKGFSLRRLHLYHRSTCRTYLLSNRCIQGPAFSNEVLGKPAALVTGIARAAVSNGAVILEGRTVQRIAVDPRLSIESDGEIIHPEYIVLALNAWTSALLPNVGGIESSLTFACATEPLPVSTLRAIGLGEKIPFYTTDYPYLWGRTMADGRVIFGSQLVFGSPAELEAMDVSTAESGTVLEALRERVRQLHPQLHEVKFSASWAGPIAFRKGLAPLLGRHPKSSRVLVAGAYTGHGVALSVRVGQLLTGAIADGQSLPDWGAF